MKKTLILLLVLLSLILAGCATFHGLGRDIEKAGNWIQQKSD